MRTTVFAIAVQILTYFIVPATSLLVAQDLDSNEFAEVKELVLSDQLYKRFSAGRQATLQKCEAFLKSIPESSIETHCGRLSADGIGWWSSYDKSTGLYRRVQEIHEKYELLRMMELGIPLGKNLVNISARDLEVFIQADREARDLECLFLACVAKQDFPELDFCFWQKFSPGTLHRVWDEIEFEFESETSVFELMRALRFAEEKDLGSQFATQAIARLLFDKFGDLEHEQAAAKFRFGKCSLERIAIFVSRDLAATISEDCPSLKRIIAAENLVLQLRRGLEELASLTFADDERLASVVVGSVETEETDKFVAKLKIRRKSTEKSIEIVFENGHAHFGGYDKTLREILRKDADTTLK